MQSLKKITPKDRQIHVFGCNYSPHTQRQTFFSQQCRSEAANAEENGLKIQEQNRKLRMELNEVQKILEAILYPGGEDDEGEGKTMMELLEQLLMLVLAKSEQNAFLRQQQRYRHTRLDEGSESIHKIESRLSLVQSRKSSATSSQKNIYIQADDHISIEPKQSIQKQASPDSRQAAMGSKYWPKVLFSIGKEVKTIGQISSNKLMKKESLHSYSKSSSQENSFKELMHLKKNRLSIDKSIYIHTDKECDPRFSVQNSSRSIQSRESLVNNNFVLSGNQLTPIKEERFSDKYSEIDCSKIKAMGINFACGERFTFESTNTDPSSYNSKHY